MRIWDYGLICSFDNHFIFPLSVFSSMRLWWVCYILIILAVFSFTLSLVHFLLACINILFSLKISPGLSDLLIALYQFTALFFSNQLTSIWKCQCATSLRLPVNIWYLIIWACREQIWGGINLSSLSKWLLALNAEMYVWITCDCFYYTLHHCLLFRTISFKFVACLFHR